MQTATNHIASKSPLPSTILIKPSIHLFSTQDSCKRTLILICYYLLILSIRPKLNSYNLNHKFTIHEDYKQNRTLLCSSKSSPEEIWINLSSQHTIFRCISHPTKRPACGSMVAVHSIKALRHL